VRIDADDIGGVVTGAKGPEAGVWVIAETKDLPTKYVKIVVTDDQGRFVLPDMPKGNYDVWVRGYGLVDSPKVKAQPGKTIDLKSVQAPNRAAAAQYYPGMPSRGGSNRKSACSRTERRCKSLPTVPARIKMEMIEGEPRMRCPMSDQIERSP